MVLEVLLAVWIGAGAQAVASPRSDETLVTLHPALPDTLTAAEVHRLGLFTDVADLDRVWFTAPIDGGVRAHLDLLPGTEPRRRERRLTRDHWREMQVRTAQVLAGEDPVPVRADTMGATAAGDTLAAGQAWPEVPWTNPAPESVLPAEEVAEAQYPTLGDRWLLQVGLGYQRNLTSYREFFTDQGILSLVFARPLSDHFIPYASFELGFGDLQRDFEAITGDGRANTYSITAGALGNTGLGRSTRLYGGAAGGYFIRSMQWSGFYRDPETGEESDGHVQEMGDWGLSLRAGVLLQRSHPRKARFLDFGLGVTLCPADSWEYRTDEQQFIGGDRDMWLILAIRYWDTL